MIVISESVTILRQTPAVLAAMLSGVPDNFVRATEGEGKWSPFDVVGHLVHGERTDWIARAKHILDGRSGPFDPFDRTAMLSESKGKSTGQLISEFADLRAANLDILRGLAISNHDLALRGLHPALGSVTLGQLIAAWVVHDLDHIAQIARTMAKVYTDEVGPWRAYLSVLEDRR